MALRLFWTYPHLVARFQEVTLFIECGLQVICADDELPSAEADRSYYDERSSYYPRWRETLDLRSDVVEQIRKINLFAMLGRPSAAERALLNRHVDIIYLYGNPEVVAGVGEWFSGTILYRVMGFPNWAGQNATFRKLNRIVRSARFRSKFVYAPAYTSMMPPKFGNVTRSVIPANPWVEKHRVPFDWSEERSKPRAVTAISYLHFHSYFQAQYRKISEAFRRYDLAIVGKNSLTQVVPRDSRVLGEMSFSELYGTIADGRVFVDAGDCPNHLIWPPLEAATMGVPVLYIATSGLVDPMRAAGYSMNELREAGMFASFGEIDEFLVAHGDDIALLRGIAIRQHSIMVRHVFARDTAKRSLLELTKHARLYSNRQRRRIFSNRSASSESLVMTQVAPLMLDGRESRWFMPQQMRVLLGQIERRNNGRPTLVLETGRDKAGLAIETYLPSISSGYYIATVLVEFYEAAKGEAVRIELGPWVDGVFQPVLETLESPVKGLWEAEFEIAIPEGGEDMQRELRVTWSGQGSLGIIGLRLDPKPFPDWLPPRFYE